MQRDGFFTLALLPSGYTDIFAGFELLSHSKATKQLNYLLVHTVSQKRSIISVCQYSANFFAKKRQR